MDPPLPHVQGAPVMAARHRQAKKTAQGRPKTSVRCQECARPAGLVTGQVVYPGRPDLHAKTYWRCCACGAYVGCHPGTELPLGTPCGPITRAARSEAHAAFDPLWRAKMARDGVQKHVARGAAYRWLAAELGIDPGACHIGMMDAATAKRVVEICKPYARAA